MSRQRIGFGYDIHRFAPGRRLVLGGVDIPYKHGLLGHSDADVLVHAAADALLGALSLGDIGLLFPNTDKRYKDISSMKILMEVCGLVEDKGFGVVNIDIMLILEAPKIGIYRKKMRSNIARVLGVGPERVSVKATTNEGVGLVGQYKAAAAYAVVLIENTPKRRKR